MPPPGTEPPLTEDEKMLFARWVDLGAPIDSGNPAFGWLLDDLRPTVELSLPRPGFNGQPVSQIRVGLADANSGVDLAALSISADFMVDGRAPGSELADLAAASGDGIWTIPLATPLPALTDAHLFVEVADVQGNFTRIDRRFSTIAACAGAQNIALANDTVDDVRWYEACESIAVGPSYEIQATGDVTLRARAAIHLGDGFDLRPGGRLAAVIDPAAAAP